MSSALELAREQRLERAIDREIDQHIEKALAGVKLAAPIGPQARVKLRGILKKYARSPHPFRACVKDNMSRFGPGRTEAICATLKDQIKGTKSWRKGGGHKLSDEEAQIDADVLLLVDALSEGKLQAVMLAARAFDEHGTDQAISLLGVTGTAELERWGERV